MRWEVHVQDPVIFSEKRNLMLPHFAVYVCPMKKDQWVSFTSYVIFELQMV